jgi:ELWxxDGT repeat protein
MTHTGGRRKPTGLDRAFRPQPVDPLERRCLLYSPGLTASLVADIVPGPGSSNPSNLTVAGGAIYFVADDATGFPGLWRSDGTAAGTVLLRGHVGSGTYIGNVPFAFAELNGTEYFTPPTGIQSGLWKTDGTPAGTILVMPLSDYPNPTGLTAVNGKLVFAAESNVGRELWTYDGTAFNVIDVYPGTTTYSYMDKETKTKVTSIVQNSSDPEGITALNSNVFFVAYDGRYFDLWKSDGTPSGTTIVKSLSSKSGLDANPVLVGNGNVMYFGAGGYLWKSDGTPTGTVAVKNVKVSDITAVGTRLFFLSGSYNTQLWTSNGTATGTVLVKDFNYSFNTLSSVSQLTASNGTLYFSAPDSSLVHQLWRSDGTAAGTYMVKQIDPGINGLPGGPSGLTDVNGRLYFGIDDGVHGEQLWQSDGTAAGTVMVQGIYPGVLGPGGAGAAFAVLNNTLYFAATDQPHGTELWDPPAVPASVTMHHAPGHARGAHPVRAARHPLGPAHHGPVSAFRPSSRRGHHGLSS